MQEIESRSKDIPETGLLLGQGDFPIKPKHPFLEKISKTSSQVKTITLFAIIVIFGGTVIYTLRLGNTIKQFIQSRRNNFEE